MRPISRSIPVSTLAAVALAVVVVAPAADAAPVNPALPGVTQFDGWDNANITSATNFGYGAFPGSAAWPAPIGSGAAGSGDATVMKVANNATGGPYPASGSIYFGSFGGGPSFGGTLSVADATPLAGVKNVVLQVDLAPADEFTFFNDVLPALSFNGGTQALAPTVSGIINRTPNGVVSTPAGDIEIFRDTWLLQWDLSSVSGPITDLDVRFSAVPHVQVYGLRLDQSDTFAAVAVPEPASLGLFSAATAVGLLSRRKRR